MAAMLRRLIAAAAVALCIVAVPVFAADGGHIDVVVVRGNLDARLADFAIDSIESSSAALIVLQVDVGAVLHERAFDLFELVADPPTPVVVWAGPAPGTVRGAAVLLLGAAHVSGAAPGVTVGPASPLVSGGLTTDPEVWRFTGLVDEVVEGSVTIGVGGDGVVDLAEPSIGQFIMAVHGSEVTVGGESRVLDTARTEVVDGVEVLLPSRSVRFVEPGVVDRVLSLGTQASPTLFFLVFGLALIVFEFYAAGPGIAAVIGAAMLLLAGHGLVTLPVWWPAVAAVAVGVALYVVEFQRNDLGWKSILGTGLLWAGGHWMVGSDPFLRPTWWVTVLVVAGAAAFFAFALTTVARSRFATQTIGRSHLIGRSGVADGPVAPDGYVTVDGARWRARAARASGIGDGDPVRVTAVDGITLDVEPHS